MLAEKVHNENVMTAKMLQKQAEKVHKTIGENEQQGSYFLKAYLRFRLEKRLKNSHFKEMKIE